MFSRDLQIPHFVKISNSVSAGAVTLNAGRNADGLCEVDPNQGRPCGNISGRCFSINNSRKSVVGVNGQICVGSQCP